MSIHLDNWLRRVDIDYYNMFILSWIPFNTWYVHNFYDDSARRTSDRDLINYLKLNDNSYKSKITNLLQNNVNDSIEFKKLISELHIQLETNSVPNEDNRISFRHINLFRNQNNSVTVNFNKKIYQFEFSQQLPRTSKRFTCTIMKNNPARTTQEIIELFSCRRAEIEQHQDYLNKNQKIRNILLEGFNSIDPNKPENIVSNNNSGIKISDDLYFNDNLNLISQVIIELLYQLRCKIFHGEINPNATFHKTYELAYKIQSILLKSLN